MSGVGGSRLHGWRLALTVTGAYTLLFTWRFARPLLDGTLLAESDLYEYYLPVFLAPITTWSSYEFAGLPAFADPGDSVWYPPHFLFARVTGSWTGLTISAHVLASSFMFASVYKITRSRARGRRGGPRAWTVGRPWSNACPTWPRSTPWPGCPCCWPSREVRTTPPPGSLGSRGRGGSRLLLPGGPSPAGPLRLLPVRRVPTVLRGGGWDGDLLASVKTVPLVEASWYMVRQAAGFGQFVSHANSWSEMWLALFPTVLHEGREAPTYFGLATLLLGVGDGTPGWRGSRSSYRCRTTSASRRAT